MENLYKIKEPENDYIVGKISNGMVHYDFKKVITFLEAKGKILFGSNFKIHKEDHFIIYKLIIYTIKDEKSCKANGMDIQKGILLNGPIGCGKTSLMVLVNFLNPYRKRYQVKPARTISYEFIKKGHDVITAYTNAKTYCFDDLGIERNLKYFGNECNVLGEIILSRYDLWRTKKVITHATTNLNAQELENYYGNRVRSRMRELFNLIAFDKRTKDKRK